MNHFLLPFLLFHDPEFEGILLKEIHRLLCGHRIKHIPQHIIFKRSSFSDGVGIGRVVNSRGPFGLDTV
jgi:hypothetical protein